VSFIYFINFIVSFDFSFEISDGDIQHLFLALTGFLMCATGFNPPCGTSAYLHTFLFKASHYTYSYLSNLGVFSGLAVESS
jgi:hypothetical protein